MALLWVLFIWAACCSLWTSYMWLIALMTMGEHISMSLFISISACLCLFCCSGSSLLIATLLKGMITVGSKWDAFAGETGISRPIDQNAFSAWADRMCVKDGTISHQSLCGLMDYSLNVLSIHLQWGQSDWILQEAERTDQRTSHYTVSYENKYRSSSCSCFCTVVTVEVAVTMPECVIN